MADETVPTAPDQQDMRRHERFPCKLKVTYTIISKSDTTPFEFEVTHTKDLSESGVCIFTERDVRPPVLLQLNISVPARPFHLLILGKAVWCRPSADSPNLHEVGIKFVGILPPNFREMIKEFAPSVWSDSKTSPEAQ